jgi:hypothetical protein
MGRLYSGLVRLGSCAEFERVSQTHCNLSGSKNIVQDFRRLSQALVNSHKIARTGAHLGWTTINWCLNLLSFFLFYFDWFIIHTILFLTLQRIIFIKIDSSFLVTSRHYFLLQIYIYTHTQHILQIIVPRNIFHQQIWLSLLKSAKSDIVCMGN